VGVPAVAVDHDDRFEQGLDEGVEERPPVVAFRPDRLDVLVIHDVGGGGLASTSLVRSLAGEMTPIVLTYRVPETR